MGNLICGCLENCTFRGAETTMNYLPVTPKPVIDDHDLTREAKLSDPEKAALRTFFRAKTKIRVIRPLTSGRSGARIYLARPDRDAPILVKIASSFNIAREYEAYELYVKTKLPNDTARIMGEPQRVEDGDLAMLIYSYLTLTTGADDDDALRRDTSIQQYYNNPKPPQAVTKVIEQVFINLHIGFYEHQRPSQNKVRYRRYYDRLLPAHLVLEEIEQADKVDLELDSQSPVTEATHQATQELKIGAIVRLNNFIITKIDTESDKLTLTLWSHMRATTNTDQGSTSPIRVEIVLARAALDSYEIQGLFSTPYTRVTQTRQTLLEEKVQALANVSNRFRVDGKNLRVDGKQYKNPIYYAEEILKQSYNPTLSLVHGDLNLQNILVHPATGHPWLIDFADTREAPTPYDLQTMEMQILTLLLPQAKVKRHQVGALLEVLHQDATNTKSLSSKLDKPYACLTTLREMVRENSYYPNNRRETWSEGYYPGLIIVLLGALKYKNISAEGHIFALLAASKMFEWTKMGRISPKQTMPSWAKWLIGLLVVIIFLLMGILGWVIWNPSGGLPPAVSTQTPTPTTTLVDTPTVLPTSTSAPPTATIPATVQTKILSPTIAPPIIFPATADEAIAQIRQHGVITVGVRFDAAPFGEDKNFGEGKKDCDYRTYDPEFQPKGFDIALAHEFASRWLDDPNKVRFVCVTSSSRFTATLEARVDFIAASMSATKARCELILCNGLTYFEDSLALLVHKDEVESIQNVCNLDGKTVSLLEGTNAIGIIDDIANKRSATIYCPYIQPPQVIITTTRRSAIEAVIRKSVNAYITSYSILKASVVEYPDLTISPVKFASEAYNLGMPKGSIGLKALINLTLQEMKADGSYDTLYLSAFGNEYPPSRIPIDNSPRPTYVQNPNKLPPSPTPVLSTPPPTTHQIQPGDTLGELARLNYGDYSLWNCIKKFNNNINERSLPVGQTLTIPPKEQCQ